MPLGVEASDHTDTVKNWRFLITASLVAALAFYGLAMAGPSHDFSQTDIRFMQEMSIHHEQAITMSEWAPERTNNSELLELARNISDVQAREHRKMERWVQEAGHDPHPATLGSMAGMATQQEMQRLNNSTGRQFDLLYLELMIDHHIGGVEMAQREVRNGSSEELKEMARNMIEVQRREIELMEEWRQQWNETV